ncbi:unnamed protein product [Schistosoma margrebowiei]|uniref:Uncharacterized protein n=1 Tax=Schistosoma margrebowiei TaxID=48269 RepID=A0A183M3K1_9TREM|nr:unnamed protein product [Schistosoma margrebowiei]
MKGVSTRNYKVNHKFEMEFGKCLSCGKFHSRNSCAFRNAERFKCGKIRHIQLVCKATVHFASSSTKYLNLNLNNSDVSSDHLSLSTISKGDAHIQKRLYTSLGSFHDFIVDTDSIESIISFKNLKSLDPNVVIRTTEVSILGITGHRLPIRGCCELLIRDDNSSYIPCEVLVSEIGLSILYLKRLKRLKVELSFLVSKENSDTLLKDLIATCANCSGCIKIQPIKLQVQGDPFFLKRRIIPYGLREAVNKTFNDLCAKGIIEPIQSSAWDSPPVVEQSVKQASNRQDPQCVSSRNVIPVESQPITSLTEKFISSFRICGLRSCASTSRPGSTHAYVKNVHKPLTLIYQAYLGIKYYPPDPTIIADEQTRILFEKDHHFAGIDHFSNVLHKWIDNIKSKKEKVPQQASAGLSIHKGKTKVLKFKVENNNPVTLDGETLKDVEYFTYLGSIIDEQGGSDADVKARIGKARTAFLQLKNIWNSKQLSININVRIFSTNTKAVSSTARS